MNTTFAPPYQANGPIEPITCVEMHTAGEPTRILRSGFPELTGTLLEQRDQAKANSDHFRRLLMLEPRGHYDMYGAILRPETELVHAGDADIGVLFMHNEGFSTMCGHATIALGRFLVDSDESVFPRRGQLKYDAESGATQLNLHVPCGLVKVTVPTLSTGKSDPARPVSFISVPSFATAISLEVPVPEPYRWPELQERCSVTADFSYGGAYYCLISAEELGFTGGLAEFDLQKMDRATGLLKKAITTNPDLKYLTRNTITGEQGFLYSVMITDKGLGHVAASEGTAGFRAQQGVDTEETGLCFFANQQIDRSPTGGCVAARVALAHAKGELSTGEKRLYNSLVTRSRKALAGFGGSVFEIAQRSVDVKVEGYAYYTGYHTFVVENEDGLGVNGFSMKDLVV
ncbi:Proline racemase [Penicillium angulare]|uniref:Proline racemase n=1 Tax=Penicillium angulare TaxID=116970 RepID=UPI002540DE88|nr:Proline racemase [Penicillium angulare]KAJ5259323.1 Proline racemase [Penicillium angulare]